MTGAALATSHTEGGRAPLRALFRAASLLLCLTGLAITAQGLWIPVKAGLAQILLDRAFESSLAEHRPVKPWPWADTAPVARVSVKRIGASDVVLSGGSGQAMAFGPALLARRGRGVTVLAAHRDTHFAFVRDLRKGDMVRLERIDGSVERYRVSTFQTVRWDGFAVPSDPPRALLALATCYPFDATESGPWRRVAWAEKVE
jgi:sortase A